MDGREPLQSASNAAPRGLWPDPPFGGALPRACAAPLRGRLVPQPRVCALLPSAVARPAAWPALPARGPVVAPLATLVSLPRAWRARSQDADALPPALGARLPVWRVLSARGSAVRRHGEHSPRPLAGRAPPRLVGLFLQRVVCVLPPLVFAQLVVWLALPAPAPTGRPPGERVLPSRRPAVRRPAGPVLPQRAGLLLWRDGCVLPPAVVLVLGPRVQPGELVERDGAPSRPRPSRETDAPAWPSCPAALGGLRRPSATSPAPWAPPQPATTTADGRPCRIARGRRSRSGQYRQIWLRCSGERGHRQCSVAWPVR